ncbi:MAG: hypothetical protein J7623_26705 [Chitinophaga sp.]|uniref:hypothetical protein n=1 Tax=Chitinophaga sp. TaxID=1869181 RepID=UPI001B1A2A7D|nr:hypothetical protein [Chitinophaga sp.]MBO9732261.1 hypothetical protein [Chitinophaga sp.]
MPLTLGLQYHEQQAATIAGAFIPGHSADAWLAEIDRWGIPMQSLKGLLIAANKDTLTPAGLLVMLQHIDIKYPDRILHPYQLTGGKLFIPATARLTPALHAAELSQLLIWDWQVFHPVWGFTGFEVNDVIDISALLFFTSPQVVDWEFARIGIAPRIKLRRIEIMASDTDPFAEIRREVGHLPLSELPPAATPLPIANSFFQKIWQKLAHIFGQTASYTASLLPKNLQDKRNQELEKLLQMFDKDEALALQYALPMDSPYEHRGTATPGTSLQRQNTNFSLGRLGGGGPADVWDAGSYRFKLIQKYEAAAKAAISTGDYKKAAYIYAHLLGNYAHAANVLEQGGHYREAAILYKDHLKKPGAAAHCLEKGGLLLEAIDMYISLQQLEKAGDLYMQLDQQEHAITLYEQVAATAINNHDMLAAASVIQHKLSDIPRAKQILLQGWDQHLQTNACLQRYLELSADQLVPAIQLVYDHHLSPSLENNFLQLLSKTGERFQQAPATDLAKDIAYEIISKQSLQGNTENLALLNTFVPEDRLLPRDCSRFINHLPKPVTVSKALSSERFAADVKWITGRLMNDELLLIGHKSTGVYMLRYDFMKHWNYMHWPGHVPDSATFRLLSDTRYNNMLLIYHHLPFEITQKHFSQYRADEEVVGGEFTVGGASWLPSKLLGYCFSEWDVVALHLAGEELILSRYTQEGALKNSVRCTQYTSTSEFELPPDFQQEAQEMVYWYGAFYLFIGHSIYKLDFQGGLQSLLETDRILQLTAGYDRDKLGMVAITEDSILWLTYTYGDNTPKIHGSIANNEVGIKVKYLPHEFIITYRDKTAQVYKISDGAEAVYSQKITTRAPICAIEAIPKKGHIAIVSENGELEVYDLYTSSLK